MIFDTHTHYDDEAYDTDRKELLSSLPEKGVGLVCNIGASMNGARQSVGFSEAYEHIYAAAGVHPDEVYDFFPGMKPEEIEALFEELSYEYIDNALGFDVEITKKQDEKICANAKNLENFSDGACENNSIQKEALKRITEFCNTAFKELELLGKMKKTVAVGEIGLDYHGFGVYEIKPGKKVQRYCFLRQLELAIKLDLPAVIHSRNACEDTMDIMRAAHKKGLKKAVIHCYSYSKETAREYLEMGCYLGFGGVITYEGQKKLTKSLEITPLDRILIETDCPYLTPVPIREKGTEVRNDSTYLPYVIKRVAEIKGVEPQEIEDISFKNACRFYGIENAEAIHGT